MFQLIRFVRVKKGIFILTLLAFFTGHVSLSQSLERDVLNNSGSYFTNSNYQIHSSFAEVIAGEYSNLSMNGFILPDTAFLWIGIEEPKESKLGQLNVYPIPSNKEINITSSTPIDAIKIFDLKSQLVYFSNYNKQQKVSIELLESGMYFMEVKYSNGIKERIKVLISK